MRDKGLAVLLRSQDIICNTEWNRLRRTIEVEALAAQRRHAASWPLEEYLSIGLLTVAECIQGYDASAGASFAWYAGFRVRYAMAYVPRYLSVHCQPMVWDPLDLHTPGPLTAPLEEPESSWVAALLAVLTPPQARCVQRCWLDGQSPQAVAEECGCHRSAVVAHLERARRKLQAAVKGHTIRKGPPKGRRKPSRLDGQESVIGAFLSLGLSKEAIAQRLGVSRGALASFLRSRRIPGVEAV